ncbi:hypothetical protein [Pedobacter hiemivivus]|uniref:Uncharacterized protein n=1 Tax=Pedobacter hiemivivus TaxID=2530454 RepID=A0A4R0NF66_9SPHI|nr:hypothetical protein [Pedobacter hiemivivus]TCC98788.1 hypothetical protein EZ444_05805 [Pedobacter hiemivivus]
MSYLQFALWLTGGYSGYYLLNILYDSTRKDRQTRDESAPVLSFAPDLSPQKVQPKQLPEAPEPEPASVASGAVSLQGLFALARKETIELTRQVSF